MHFSNTVKNRDWIVSVSFEKDSLIVNLQDGRKIGIPLEWYPRLVQATDKERNHYILIGEGEGIHWPDLDEDISLEGILKGQRSGEAPNSFRDWLSQRNPN